MLMHYLQNFTKLNQKTNGFGIGCLRSLDFLQFDDPSATILQSRILPSWCNACGIFLGVEKSVHSSHLGTILILLKNEKMMINQLISVEKIWLVVSTL